MNALILEKFNSELSNETRLINLVDIIVKKLLIINTDMEAKIKKDLLHILKLNSLKFLNKNDDRFKQLLNKINILLNYDDKLNIEFENYIKKNNSKPDEINYIHNLLIKITKLQTIIFMKKVTTDNIINELIKIVDKKINIITQIIPEIDITNNDKINIFNNDDIISKFLEDMKNPDLNGIQQVTTLINELNDKLND